MPLQKNNKPLSYLIQSGKKFSFVLPPLVSVTILLLIYGAKGIYPFGQNTVLKNDLIQFHSPIQYYFFDVFHGKASLLYNFQSFGGMNFWGEYVTNLTSPFNLILLFFKRDQILYAGNILVLVKISLCSFTSFFFLRKIFPKISFFWSNLLSLSYAFSGYVLISYPILCWLDVVALFPLLALSLIHLAKNNKGTYYIITLSLMVILSWYLAFLVLLFILFSSYLYMKFYVPISERSKFIRLLGLSTIVSLLITLPITLPTLIQIQTTTRAASLYSILQSMQGTDVMAFFSKINYFFMTSLPVSFLLLMLAYPKKNKRLVFFLLSLLVLTVLPVLIEPINKMWHLGSYFGFFLRFGFIPIFLFINLSAYFLQSYIPTKEINKKPTWLLILIMLLIGSLLSLAMYAIIRYYPAINDQCSQVFIDFGTSRVLLYWFILFTWIYVNLWQFGNQTKQGKIFRSLLLFVFLIQLSISSVLFIGNTANQQPTNQEFKDLSILYKEFREEKDFFRFKDADTLFNSNYNWIAGVNSLSSFTSFGYGHSFQLMNKLGYSTARTRTMDRGGTLFSDFLYQVKYIIKQKATEDPSLILHRKKDRFFIYRSKYFTPLGLSVQNRDHLTDLPTTLHHFDLQNDIFTSLSGIKDNLFVTYPFSEIKKLDNHWCLQQSISIQNKRRLYLTQVIGDSFGVNQINQVSIVVNGQLLQTDVVNELLRNEAKPTNTINLYPSPFNNGFLDLGEFEHTTVTISLRFHDKIKENDYLIGSMDISLFDRYYQSRKNLPIDIEIKSNRVMLNAYSEEESRLLLLTLPFDKSWSITNQGKNVKPVVVFGTFLGIPLSKGDNNIKMTYSPFLLKESIFISLFALLFCLILYLLNIKKKYLTLRHRFDTFFSVIYYIILTGATILIFIIPFIISII